MIEMRKPTGKPTWLDWTRTAVLLGMTVYFVVLIATGSLANYINLRFQWLSYVAAGLFALLGLWDLYRLLRPAAHGGRMQGHMPIGWASVGIVAIPLILALLIPSQPLGASAINGGVNLNPVGVGSAATFSRNPLDRNILDWLREFSRVNNPSELNGEPVDVIGFVYREPHMGEDQFMIARFTLSCCVADAFAIGIPVQYTGAAEFGDGQWIRIQGRLAAGEFNDEYVPIIQPDQVEPVEQPDSPYLYS